MSLYKCNAFAAVWFKDETSVQSVQQAALWLRRKASRFAGEVNCWTGDHYAVVALDAEYLADPGDAIIGEACQYVVLPENQTERSKLNVAVSANPASSGMDISLPMVLKIARGMTGAQPLYYGRSDNATLVCSNLHFLNQAGLEIDISAVQLFLRFFYIPSPYTIYKSVRSLQPSEALELPASFKSVPEFSMHPLSTESEELNDSDSLEKAIEKFGRALTSACSASLKGVEKETNVGLLLSGGKDSSGIAVALSSTHKEVHALTVGFAGTDVCEANDAKRVAESLGLTGYIFNANETSVLNGWERFCSLIGQPMADPAAYPLFLALTGDFDHYQILLDGTGNDRYFGLVPGSRSKALWRFKRALFRLRVGSLLPILAKISTLQLPSKLSMPPQEQFVSWSGYERHQVEKIIGKSVDWESLPLYQIYENCNSPEAHMNATICGIWEPEAAYRKLMQTATVTGKSVRYPYVNPSLVKLLAEAPNRFRFHNGSNKWILRRYLETNLPRDIVRKPKGSFVFPKEFLLNPVYNYNFSSMLSREAWCDLGFCELWSIAEESYRRYQSGDSLIGGKVYALYLLFTWLYIELKGTKRGECIPFL